MSMLGTPSLCGENLAAGRRIKLLPRARVGEPVNAEVNCLTDLPNAPPWGSAGILWGAVSRKRQFSVQLHCLPTNDVGANYRPGGIVAGEEPPDRPVHLLTSDQNNASDGWVGEVRHIKESVLGTECFRTALNVDGTGAENWIGERRRGISIWADR